MYESDAIDNFSCLQSDDQQSYTPDVSSSQQLIASATDLGFVRPLSIPSSLERVGPDRKKSWILYSDMSKDDFITWWLETHFGGTQVDRKKVHWDGAKHHSDIWAHFDQVAHYTSGEPKVMCRNCGKILHHPNYTSNGTNSLRRHWKSDGCQKATNKAARQPNIQKLMQDAVRLSQRRELRTR